MSIYNGYCDEDENEREGEDFFEDMGKYDEYEGWPSGSCGPEYYLNKGLHRPEEDEE